MKHSIPRLNVTSLHSIYRDVTLSVGDFVSSLGKNIINYSYRCRTDSIIRESKKNFVDGIWNLEEDDEHILDSQFPDF